MWAAEKQYELQQNDTVGCRTIWFMKFLQKPTNGFLHLWFSEAPLSRRSWRSSKRRVCHAIRAAFLAARRTATPGPCCRSWRRELMLRAWWMCLFCWGTSQIVVFRRLSFGTPTTLGVPLTKNRLTYPLPLCQGRTPGAPQRRSSMPQPQRVWCPIRSDRHIDLKRERAPSEALAGRRALEPGALDLGFGNQGRLRIRGLGCWRFGRLPLLARQIEIFFWGGEINQLRVSVCAGVAKQWNSARISGELGIRPGRGRKAWRTAGCNRRVPLLHMLATLQALG